MKRIISTLLLIVIVKVLAVAGGNPSGQYYYVVVGGFNKQENAAEFSERVIGMNYPATYAYSAERNLYYVYVFFSYDKQNAVQIVYRMRSQKEFKDAWIYSGNLPDKFSPQVGLAETKKADDQKIRLVLDKPVAVETGKADKMGELNAKGEHAVRRKKSYVFKLVDAVTKQEVKGSVKLLESEKEPGRYQYYAANEAVLVPAPGNSSGKLVLVCDVFGYQATKKVVLFNPVKSKETYGAGGEVVIPVTLQPLKKGAYVDLDQIKFFENSAILTPESERELMELVHTMKNPRYRIVLHGHVASDNGCEAILPGHHSKNFFDIEAPDNHHRHVSAKALSHHRAETLKRFLVSKGVSAKRIRTKGYGATLAIFEHAHANDRIEVQIVNK